jgi:hypothetical protein
MPIPVMQRVGGALSIAPEKLAIPKKKNTKKVSNDN